MNEASRVTPTAIVVLGCRVLPTHAPSTTLARRVDHALAVWRDQRADLLLLSGGREWNGVREADVMRARAVDAGVPERQTLCECRSRNTRENALFCREILLARRIAAFALVTSDWHMARAVLAFRRVGLDPLPFPARTPDGPRVQATLRELREAARRAVDRLAMLFEARS